VFRPASRPGAGVAANTVSVTAYNPRYAASVGGSPPDDSAAPTVDASNDMTPATRPAIRTMRAAQRCSTSEPVGATDSAITVDLSTRSQPHRADLLSVPGHVCRPDSEHNRPPHLRSLRCERVALQHLLVVCTCCRVVDTFFNPCFPSSEHVLACTESGLSTPPNSTIPCKLFRPRNSENVQTQCKLNGVFRAT
jgi:hypothetical protein